MRRLLIPGMLFAGLLVASPSGAATITFESARVNPNESFVVSVMIDDVADLISFNFDFGFDPSVVGTPTVTRGNIFAGVGDPCDLCFFPGFAPSDPVSGVPGVVSFISDAILGQASVTGGGTLAVLTFQALAGGGDAGLLLSNVLLSDSQFNPIEGTIIVNGEVTVVPAAVPEPSTLGLLGVGLLALVRRLRSKTPVAR